jgi:ankyrin repeat protein
VNDDALREYRRAIAVLESGDAAQLEALARAIDGFPHGVDAVTGRRWIMNALGSGSALSVRWMLDRRVDLAFRDAEGFTPLHVALQRPRADRLDLLERLLATGAPVNLKGINDWTPAHMAAAQDDVDALRILVRHGADLSIRTSRASSSAAAVCSRRRPEGRGAAG